MGAQVRAGHRKVRRDLKANWPEGWELEAQRLASFYVRTIEGINAFDEDLAKRRGEARKLRKLKGLAEKFSRGLQELVDGDDADPLVRMSITRSARRELTQGGGGELDRLLAYAVEIRIAVASSAEIGADLDGAVQRLSAREKLDTGNQSTLALRFTIAAAAAAYAKLFGKAPGRSRSDYGTFGHFVIEIIACISERHRPSRPSPSAISEVVEQWERRRTVAG